MCPGHPLVCATKGMETDTLEFMSEVAAEAMPQATFVALSGAELRRRSASGAADRDRRRVDESAALDRIQQLFSTPTFRVYSNTDVVGVELGGSLKNTMAIATGILDGLGLGHNPRAALLTRGLAEIVAPRRGAGRGAQPPSPASPAWVT